MRSRFGLVGTTTSLLLAAAVVTAAPAEARRNLGGLVGEECVAPGNAVPQTVNDPRPGVGATCICIINLSTGAVDGPNGKCPPGNDPARRK